MQKNATSLVRSSAPLDQLDSFAGSNSADTDGHGCAFPTLEQHAAIDILRAFDEEKILAWITVIRSIQSGFQHRAGHGALSSEQLDALSILKDCHDSDIVAWLQYKLLSDNVDKQRIKPSSASPSRQSRRSSAKSALRSSISSLAPSSVLSSRYSTPRSSLGHGQPLAQLVEANLENGESDHKHWCTHGEHSKPVYTCEGWKRHEKEHERGFLCMPDGPVLQTRNGRSCALCDWQDPSPEHLKRHNISICIGNTKGPLKRSRKGDMMKHLTLHGISGPAGAVLADKWRFDLKKKAYSCGLCVTIFSSIIDRSNHIDNEHWKSGQTMSAWDLSNVIRGLLLRPEVEAAWQNILRLEPDLVESNLRWGLPKADGLQLRLEMGEETGAVLAKAALELSSYSPEVSSHTGATRVTKSETTFVDSSYPTAWNSLAIPTTASPRSIYNTTTSIFRPGAISSRVRPGFSPLYDMNSSKSGFHASPGSPAQQGLASLPDPVQSAWPWTQSEWPWTQSEWPSSSFFVSGDSETDLQSMPYSLPVEWQSSHQSLPPDAHARIPGVPSENGAMLVSQVASPRHGQSSIRGQHNRHACNPNFRSGNDNPDSELGISPLAYVQSYHEYLRHSYEKPLPNLPSTSYEAAEPRSKSPMDLESG